MRLRCSIRELLWLTALVALGIGSKPDYSGFEMPTFIREKLTCILRIIGDYCRTCWFAWRDCFAIINSLTGLGEAIAEPVKRGLHPFQWRRFGNKILIALNDEMRRPNFDGGSD